MTQTYVVTGAAGGSRYNDWNFEADTYRQNTNEIIRQVFNWSVYPSGGLQGGNSLDGLYPNDPLPTTSDDVIIGPAGGYANFPVVINGLDKYGNTARVHDLYIRPSSSLTVNGTLTLSDALNSDGTVTINGYHGYSGNGQLIVSSGTTTFSGAGLVRMNAFGTASTIFNNVSGTTGVLENSTTIAGGGMIGVSGGYIGGPSDAHLVLHNHGTINADSGTDSLTISPGTAVTTTNDGLMEGTGNAGLVLFNVNLDQRGAGTLAAYGAGSHVDLVGAVLRGGFIDGSGGGVVQVATSGGNGGQQQNTIDGRTTADGGLGAITIRSGGTLSTGNYNLLALGTIANNGVLFDDNTLTVGAGGLTLTGGGTVTLGHAFDSNNPYSGGAIAGYSSTTAVTLHNVDNTIVGHGSIGIFRTSPSSADQFLNIDNQASAVINANNAHAGIDISSTTIVNSGLIESTAGRLSVHDVTLNQASTGILAALGSSAHVGFINDVGAGLTITNNGLFEAVNGGTLSISAVVTGSGSALVSSGGTLSFGTTFNQNITFDGTNTVEMLQLGAGYGGTITGLGIGDRIDFTNLGYASGLHVAYAASSDGGTLSILDSGNSNLASIHIAGDYSASGFGLSDDGFGHTLLTTNSLLQAPTVSLAAIAGDDVINQGEARAGVAVSGTTTNVADGGIVTVVLRGADGAILDRENAIVSANAFTVTLPSTALHDGAATVTADVTTRGGSAPEASRAVTIDLTAPTISLVLERATASNGHDEVQLIGFVEANAGTRVEIFDGATDLGAATITSQSTSAGRGWSFATTFTDGSHSLHAVATDAAGNTASTTIAPSISGDTATFALAFTDAHINKYAGGAQIVSPDGSMFTNLTGFNHYTFTDGTVNEHAGSALVDDLFYFSHNLDVWNAHLDATAHYNGSGWHEGRDPDAFFSTTGYLAANADVRAAGINPLAHYDANGWHEGRDPSAAFDDELYLARNPDVAQAGIDPLAHYLTNGQAEGRQAYAAVGRAADLGTHPGFDAEYYLLNNSDVARAAIAAGGDSFAFAYNHYEANGWHEGRNPNAVFDVNGYLAAYGDVRAANVDPLAHYDANGWREGRDPSANFDTRAYEAHYTDVAAAHIDPMLHYLQSGAIEGRMAFSDGHFG